VAFSVDSGGWVEEFASTFARIAGRFRRREPRLSWTEDVGRCAAAGVPAGTTCATKIMLGRRMLDRALDAGVPAGWATADELYGGDRSLRGDLQGRRLGYVLAVAKATGSTSAADTVLLAVTTSRPP
jgi:hypothetical protein